MIKWYRIFFQDKEIKGIRYIHSECDIVYILKLCYTIGGLKFWRLLLIPLDWQIAAPCLFIRWIYKNVVFIKDWSFRNDRFVKGRCEASAFFMWWCDCETVLAQSEGYFVCVVKVWNEKGGKSAIFFSGMYPCEWRDRLES